MSKISKVNPEDVKSSIGTTTTTSTTTLEEGESTTSTTTLDLVCQVEDCDYVATGKSKELIQNYLNQHSKKHGEKKKSWADGGHVMKSEGEDIA